MSRVCIRAILADPVLRRRLVVSTIMATQAREGIDTTVEQAEAAYDAVVNERSRQCDAPFTVISELARAKAIRRRHVRRIRRLL